MKLQYLITMLLLLPLASANIYITEIMHSPTQTPSQTDSEWIELYNSGNEEINLNNYTIDGNPFEDISIQPNEYVVIARELLDSDDTDSDSFESYWGNNNGIWDESFRAVDGSFTLTADDTIILTDGTYNETIIYNLSFGGTQGKSIERLNINNWIESVLDGTPGQGNFTLTENIEGQVQVSLTVTNSQPEITDIIWLTDDALDPGIQIMPNVNMQKQAFLRINYNDSDSDVNFFQLEVNSRVYNSTNSTLEFAMEPYDLATVYNVTLTICDNEVCDSETSSFEYLGIISTTLNTTSLDFNMKANQEQETNLEILNSGNIIVDLELSGTNLVSNNYNISLENLQVYDNIWLPLSTTPLIDIDLMPNTNTNLQLKLNVPSGAKPGLYNGVVTVTSMESI